MKRSVSEISLVVVGISLASLIIIVLTTKVIPGTFATIESRLCCNSNGGKYENGICYSESSTFSECNNKYVANSIKTVTSDFKVSNISSYINSIEDKMSLKINKDYKIAVKNDNNIKQEKKLSALAQSSLDKNYQISDVYVINNRKNFGITSVNAKKNNEDYTLISIYNKKNNSYELQKNISVSSSEMTNYYKNLDEMEKDNKLSVNKYKVSSYDDGFYLKLDNFNYTNIEKIYNENVISAVKIYSIRDKTIIATGSGFFLSKGYVVTSWRFINNALIKGDLLKVDDYNQNTYLVEGIVTFNSDLDIVVLKLNKEVGEPVTLSSKIPENSDPVIALGTKNGTATSIITGTVLASEDNLVAVMPTPNAYQGGMLLNYLGEVVGVTKSDSIDAPISIYTTSSYLIDVQNKLNNTNFKDVNSLSVTILKSQYYYGKFETETVKIGISEELYNNYRGIGDVENTVSLKAVKVAQYNNAISFRYINDVYGTIDTMDMALDFRLQLESSGYKLKINSNTKKMYESSQYKVYILTEFNYLIIVIVEK